MSSYSLGGHVQCWAYKEKGVDRFRSGSAKQKLQATTLHASKYGKNNCIKRSTFFCSFGSSTSTPECSSAYGPKFHGNVIESQNFTPNKIMNGELNQSEDGSEIDQKLRENNSRVCSNQNESHSLFENDLETRNFERESFNIRMRQVLSEVEAKKSMIKKLREDLGRAEMSIIQSQGRESQLQDKLDIAKREVRKMRKELLQVSEIAENDRQQSHQLQREFENQFNFQNLHIIKLRKLENEQQVGTGKDRTEAMLDMEKKFRRLEKELEIEKRLKLEAKKDRDESQKEVDELLTDNENFRRRLKQHQNELEKMQDEHRELMEELNNSNINNSEALEMRVLEAEASFEMKLNDERAKYTKDIEVYSTQCDFLEGKCKNYEQQLQEAIYELKKAKEDLENAESYRQEDIDKLLEEKESLKVELKAKKGTLQSLQSSNDALIYKLSQKEREIRQLGKMKNLLQNNDDKTRAYNVLESKFKETCKMVDELDRKVKNIEAFSQEKFEDEEEQRKDDENGFKKEIKELNSKMEYLEKDKLLTENELEDLRVHNADLKRMLEKTEQKKQELQISLNENFIMSDDYAEKIEKLNAKLNSKEEEIINLNEKKRILINEMEQQKSQDRDEIREVREAFQRYKADAESKLRSRTDLVASFEVQREEMKKKEIDLMKNMQDLKKKIRENDAILLKSEIENDKLAKKIQYLEKDNSSLQNLELNMTDLQKSLELRNDECENFITKQNELLMQIQDQARQCEKLEKELKIAEEKCNISEDDNRNLQHNFSTKQHELLMQIQDQARQCEKLEKELKIAEEKCNISEDDNRNLQHNFSTKQHELLMQIQDQARQCEKLEKELKIAEEKCNISEDDNRNLSEMIRKLKKENSTLRGEIDEASAHNNRKEDEIALLEKRVEDYQEILDVMKQKEEEAKAKNKCIEETYIVNCKLTTEVNKLEEIMGGLKENVEMLDSDKNGLKEEKRIIERELEKKREKLKNLEHSEKDMMEIYAKTQIDKLTEKISSLEDELKLKEDTMHETKNENMKHMKKIKDLEKKLKEKDDLLLETKTKDAELASKNEQLEIAKSNLQNLGKSLKEFENSCNKLKTELKLKRDENENFVAKQNDLLRKIHEKERKCEKLEKKLKEAEDRWKKNENLQVPEPSEGDDLQEMQSKASGNFESIRDKLQKLTKENEVMERENAKLKKSLEESQMRKQISLDNGDSNFEKIRELQESLGSTREREKRMQSNNYELRKRLYAEENQRNSLKEKLDSLSSEIEEYKIAAISCESKYDKAKREMENWERKFNGIVTTLADTESSIQTILGSAWREKVELKKGNEMAWLESVIQNYRELAEIIKQRNEELKSKNMYIDETDKENCRLATELGKLEKAIRDSKNKVEMLENDKERLEQEKMIIERNFARKNQIIKGHNCSEKNLLQMHENLNVLENDDQALKAKCKLLQEIMGHPEMEKEVDRPGESVSEISALEYNYEEDDFEEDVDGENSHNEDDMYDMLSVVKSEEWSEVIVQNGDFFIEDDDKDMGDDLAVKEIDFFEQGYFRDNEVHAKSIDGSNLLKEGGCSINNSVDEDEKDIVDEFVSEQKKQKSSKSPVLTENLGKMAMGLGTDENIEIEDFMDDIESDDEIKARSMVKYKAIDIDEGEADRL